MAETARAIPEFNQDLAEGLSHAMLSLVSHHYSVRPHRTSTVMEVLQACATTAAQVISADPAQLREWFDGALTQAIVKSDEEVRSTRLAATMWKASQI